MSTTLLSNDLTVTNKWGPTTPTGRESHLLSTLSLSPKQLPGSLAATARPSSCHRTWLGPQALPGSRCCQAQQSSWASLLLPLGPAQPLESPAATISPIAAPMLSLGCTTTARSSMASRLCDTHQGQHSPGLSSSCCWAALLLLGPVWSLGLLLETAQQPASSNCWSCVLCTCTENAGLLSRELNPPNVKFFEDLRFFCKTHTRIHKNPSGLENSKLGLYLTTVCSLKDIEVFHQRVH